jgi:hypothetical protein
MRDPHVRFCERHGGVISRAYSTLTKGSARQSLVEGTGEGRQAEARWKRTSRRSSA